MTKDTSNLTHKAVLLYRASGSMKVVARELELSASKIRRLLITAGEYSSEQSERISELHERGMSVAQIAEALHITPHAAQGYLPYAKGIYMSPTPTKNAEAIRRCRAKKGCP